MILIWLSTLAASSLGLDHPAGYSAVDLFTGVDLGTFKPSDTFSSNVNPTSILLVKFNILPGIDNGQTSKIMEKETAKELGEDWLTVTYPAMEGWRGGKEKFEL